MTELGTRLKEARTAKGYSLDDLQEMTKIQKRYLAGIEEGDYSMMPGPFYVRAFIKQYADSVGLNSDELLESYKQELPNSSTEEVRQAIPSIPSRRRPITKSSNRLNEIFPMIVVGLFIIIGIVIFWFFYQNLATNKDSSEPAIVNEEELLLEETEVNDDTPIVAEPIEEEPIVEEPVEEPTSNQLIEMGAIEGETTNYLLSGTDSFILKMVSRGNSWISVKDQSGVEQMTPAREVKSGETITLNLNDVQSARLRVGASSQIDVYVNDEKVEYGIPTSKKVTQNMLIQFSKQQ